MSYPLRNFNENPLRGPQAGSRAVERLDEIEALARATDSQCRTWQWLKNFTALRLGGPVAAIIYPSTVQGAAQLVQQLQQAGIRWRALGHGTSILADDEVHDFVAISLRLLDERLIFAGEQVQVHAGYSLMALVNAVAERGLSGLEGFAGITGSIGGALRMAAEITGCDLWHRVETVTIAERGEAKVVPQRDLLYREIVYREGQRSLADTALILTVTLKLVSGSAVDIREETARQELVQLQRTPDVKTNASRVFSEVSTEADAPAAPVTAGEVVDQLGFKGKAQGGARISETNAEYIVNEGSATADDVLTLSDLIREQARKLRGLNLKLGLDVWRNESGDESKRQ